MASYKNISNKFNFNKDVEYNNQPDVICTHSQLLEFSSDLTDGRFTVKQEVSLLTDGDFLVSTRVVNNKSVLIDAKAQAMACMMTKKLVETKKRAILERAAEV